MRGSKVVCAAALLVVTAAGCGGDDEADPKAIAGEPKRVVAVVDRLDAAIAKRRWPAVCALMTPAARQKAGGAECARLLGEGAAGVSGTRIRVLGVAVDGRRAAVKVRTRARGQGAIDETIALVRRGRTWQIDSLAG